MTDDMQPMANAPVAVRYAFDGYGWSYLDSGSGSGWLERGLKQVDAQLLYVAVPQTYAHNAAIRDVIAERQRQVSEEGWTPEHDDQHDRDELSAAAACYAHFGWVRPSTGDAPTEWPWDQAWWKPSDRRRDLVKAGALILAEIERLDRAALLRPEGGE